MNAANRPIVLSAGGTAGHLFPAQALAEVLIARGQTVDLVTDERGDRYGGRFPARDIHIVPSATFGSRNPVKMAGTAVTLARGFARAWGLIGRLDPAVVIGFGGYPTLPPLIDAAMRGKRTAIHDQNAIMGRANRLLAGRVDMIATSFPEVKLVRDKDRPKMVQTGVPVRPAVIEASAASYEVPEPGGTLKVLVFGGSQGARVFADMVPPAIALMSATHRARLRIVQQCRPEDMDRVRSAYAEAGVEAELAEFFTDLPKRMASAQLVVSRSGASTVAELAVIGRPGLMVPLPHALDNDQLMNATALQDAKGGTVLPQAELNPQRLADDLARLMDDPAPLAATVANAKAFGNPRAAETLADAVMALAADKTIEEIRASLK